MRLCKTSLLIVALIAISTLSYGQLWKQYTDSVHYNIIKNNPDSVIAFYSKITTVLQKNAPATSNYAEACDSLGDYYYRKNQFNDAVNAYRISMQVYEKLNGRSYPAYSRSCYSIAKAYHKLKQYAQAEEYYLEVKKNKEAAGEDNSIDYANCCYSLACDYYNMEQFEKAVPLYLKAKQIQELLLGNEHPDYINTCLYLAGIYFNLGQFEKADPLYAAIKQYRETISGKENEDYAFLCHILGEVYYNMGQYDKTALLFSEALKIREKLHGKQNREYAESCGDLGLLYMQLSKYNEAKSLFIEGKQIQENLLGKLHTDYARSCVYLYGLYEKLNQYNKAESYCIESKNTFEKILGNQHPEYAYCCNNLAVLYLKMDQFKKALPLFIEAKKIIGAALGKQHPDYALFSKNIGTINRLLGASQSADKAYKESFSVNVRNLYNFFQFTNEKEKAAFIKNIFGEDDEAYSFYAVTAYPSEQPYSMSLFHRNLILSAEQDLHKQLFYANDTVAVKMYNEWIDIKKQLAAVYAQPIDKRKEDPVSLEEKADLLEKKLAALSLDFKKMQTHIDYKDIQNRLKKNEVAIEFVNYRYHNGKQPTDSIYYIALVLRKGQQLPALVKLFEKKQLDSLLVNTSNKSVNDGVKKMYTSRGIISKGNNTTLSKSAYSLVWLPLEKELKGISTIYFAPAGLLHRIAFAALPINKNEVLSDKYKLIQLATTATVTNQRPIFITSDDHLQLYGGVNYDADSGALKQSVQFYSNYIKNKNSKSIPENLTRSGVFTYLAGTESEINSIEAEAKNTDIHTTLLSGSNATEESFKALNGNSSPAIIHIATHGFFFADPKTEVEKNIQTNSETGQVFRLSDNPLFRSGLLFAGANNAWQGKNINGIEDGILTAYEVSNMYLPYTKLAVLSACETALGDIQGSEGVYGLQRSFKIAGVQNLVMSLWKVPDGETAEFMQLFYKNMFAKQCIGDAFYHAQTAMKIKYRNDPYKWAAWVLVR